MIVVVEGISAAGKTSWCRRHGAGHVVAESRPAGPAPDRDSDPRGAARFWIEENARRWQAAREMAARAGLAVCDTDPLKLHYSYGLWRIGKLAGEHWRFERDLAREAVAQGRLGLADLYLVSRIGPDGARVRRDADPSRTRRNFELHVRLGPPLIEYYGAMDAVLPERVIWTLPEEGVPAAPPRDKGADLLLFDALIDRLP
jgi:hypothetical protein